MADSEDEFVEKEYNAFLINKGLSLFADSVHWSNEMNRYHHLDAKLQYDFLYHGVRKRKRFSKWFKSINNEDISAIQEYYDYSYVRAIEALKVLSAEQLNIIKEKLEKGG